MPLETPQQGMQVYRPLRVSCVSDIGSLILNAQTAHVSVAQSTFMPLAASTLFILCEGVFRVSSCTIELCNTVPHRPHNVVVTPLSASELKVSWTASSQPSNAPPVTHYTVSWKVEDGEEDSQNTARPLTTMYQITGLAQGTRYIVTVTAHNSVGESEAATGNGTTLSGKWSVCTFQLR